MVPNEINGGHSSTNTSGNAGQVTMINYLIKMKSDTSHFGGLEIGKYFNFCEKARSDPFMLVTAM